VSINNELILYTDGACRGNPGPGGWGVLLTQGERRKEIYGGALETTNNRMELVAAIRGLEALHAHVDAVKIVSDSKYVIQGAQEWLRNWKINNWRTSARKPVKNADLWILLDAAMTDKEIAWEWVRGHTGHAGNERADELANQGVDTVILGELNE